MKKDKDTQRLLDKITSQDMEIGRLNERIACLVLKHCKDLEEKDREMQKWKAMNELLATRDGLVLQDSEFEVKRLITIFENIYREVPYERMSYLGHAVREALRK